LTISAQQYSFCNKHKIAAFGFDRELGYWPQKQLHSGMLGECEDTYCQILDFAVLQYDFKLRLHQYA
jgi:hypothetical protein